MNRYLFTIQPKKNIDFEIKVGDRIRISENGFYNLHSISIHSLTKPIAWYKNRNATVIEIDNTHYPQNPYVVKWDNWDNHIKNLWPLESIEKVFYE